MKRTILLLLAIVILIALASYATVAYFTAQKTANNIITAGNVIMELHDETTDGEPFPPNGLSGVMPGETVDKIVYVENIGDNAFYTRIKLVGSLFSNDDMRKQSRSFLIHLDIDEVNWEYKDGWFYYLSRVESGAQTHTLFTEVLFDPTIGNEYMNTTLDLEVTAEAVQCANNGATVWDATGWPNN